MALRSVRSHGGSTALSRSGAAMPPATRVNSYASVNQKLVAAKLRRYCGKVAASEHISLLAGAALGGGGG